MLIYRRCALLLRNPYFIDNMYEDQPYFSMLLVVPYCKYNCEGCQNAELKVGELQDFDVKTLSNIYKSNPFYEGVTLGGLESSNVNEDWIREFERFLQECEIQKVTIYTVLDKPLDWMLNLPVKELYIKTGAFNVKLKFKTVNIGNFNIRIGENQIFMRLK